MLAFCQATVLVALCGLATAAPLAQQVQVADGTSPGADEAMINIQKACPGHAIGSVVSDYMTGDSLRQLCPGQSRETIRIWAEAANGGMLQSSSGMGYADDLRRRDTSSTSSFAGTLTTDTTDGGDQAVRRRQESSDSDNGQGSSFADTPATDTTAGGDQAVRRRQESSDSDNGQGSSFAGTLGTDTSGGGDQAVRR